MNRTRIYNYLAALALFSGGTQRGWRVSILFAEGDVRLQQRRAGGGVRHFPEGGGVLLPESERRAVGQELSAGTWKGTEFGEGGGELSPRLAAAALGIVLPRAQGGEHQPDGQDTEDGSQQTDENQRARGQGCVRWAIVP